MEDLRTVARAEILIRKPVTEVFRAFTDPEMLTRFWLARASDRLAPEARVHWDFMVSGASVDVVVKSFESDRRILIDWSDGTSVEWTFTPRTEGTIVTVANAGFSGTDEERIATAIEATQGFTLVLCDLKTLLERGESCHIVADKALLIESARA
jgi:uncharacterized protein YndB with AHSA1/START domain